MSNIPSHVPAEAVVDFDYFNQPGMSGDPYALMDRIFDGRDPRVVFTPQNGGHWIIGGYEEMFTAARDAETFSSTSMQIPGMADEPRLIPLNMDPPEHGAYRSVLSRAFSPKHVMALEGDIRRLTNQLIDEVADRAEVEFVSAIAEPLPVLIFMRVVGLPAERYREFRDNVKKFLTEPSARSEALQFFNSELSELIERRSARPEDDLLSVMISSDINGRPPSFDEMLGFCQLLILAGLDTVTNGMSLGIRHMAIDHGLQEDVRSNPSLAPLAVEELLRRYSFANMGRIVLRDMDFRGFSIRRGDRVLFMSGGAGTDPLAYSDPRKVVLNRGEKGLPAFGFGHHRCVGMHLARLELRVLYEEWLRRIPQFSLSSSHAPVFHGGVVIGLESLHLTWRG